MGSSDKIALYCHAAKAAGIAISQPCLNLSEFNFTIKDNCIIFPLSAIKGVGIETVKKIMEVREKLPNHKFANIINTIGLLANNGVGKKTIETLIKVGCFDCLLADKQRIYYLHNLEEIFNKSQTQTAEGKFMIEPTLEEKSSNNEDAQLNEDQLSLLGVSFSESKIAKLRKSYQGPYSLVTLNKLDQEVNHALVQLVSFRIQKTKTGKEMAFCKIEDDTKALDILVFPTVYSNVATILEKGKIYVVTIKPIDNGFQALSFKPFS